ncbi:Transposase DDE domain-containing protein [Modestobacter sp. DSM 44400]|uniref:ISAs1 family transposase n=1 Tax=Modestobacter sp. DSM 44400 TaxID=1550230 RepID=UPI00089A8ACC|nr:ISAs1 family transposase [Modestobacter sp. DSM 44400]SDY57026.1 Transposase DDE domain-containing protein [Modestobacter sp. DSM 44400]
MPASPSSLSTVTDAVGSLVESGSDLSLADSIRLITVLGSVPDPRKPRGRRHSLQSVLKLVVGAVIAGKTSIVAIAGWAARADHQLAHCGPTPSAATFTRVLAAVYPVALQGALDRWIAGRREVEDATAAPDGQTAADDRPPGPREVIAVDGKVLRGARTTDGQVKLVAAYDQTDGVVLGQVAVEGGDEIAALPAVLDTLPDPADVLVTADALHCQRSHAVWLHDRGERTTP